MQDFDGLIGSQTELDLAIEAAEAALTALERGDRSTQRGAPRRRMTPSLAPTRSKWSPGPQVDERPRLHATLPIRHAWDAFREATIAHVAREREDLAVLVEAWRASEVDTEAGARQVAASRAEHASVQQLCGDLRVVTLPVSAIRAEFDRVVAAWDAHVRTQELALFPALLGPQGAHTPPPTRYQTDDDIGRSLRAARASRPQLAPEPSKGFGAWLKRLTRP